MGLSEEELELWRLAEDVSIRLRQGGGLSMGTIREKGRLGDGLDFVGHQPYRIGDDVRHVDWSLYGRTRDLYIRQFEDEARGRLIILVDGSGSMSIGSPTKWAVARRLASTMAFAALKGLHPVTVGVLTDGEWSWLPTGHGQEYAWKLAEFMRDVTPSGRGGFEPALKRLWREQMTGQVIVLSDFLDETSIIDGFLAWGHAHTLPMMCRIESPGEFDVPSQGGSVADPEGTGRGYIPGDAPSRAALAQRIHAHRQRFVDTVGRAGIPYCDVQADAPLSTLVSDLVLHLAMGPKAGGLGQR